MTIKEAISKARDGGYPITPFVRNILRDIDHDDSFRDESWWHCFGKAMGWSSNEWNSCRDAYEYHIAEGGNAEEWFAGIQ
jgi:hypothetical protein